MGGARTAVRIGRSTDAIPAPSASACNAIQAAVLALPQRQRELLLLHVDGLTYRQIASRTGLPDAVVLRELVEAYCSLRWTAAQQLVEDAR